jgi:protein tyrosine phosphatase (PTP) superfamily phosphohydrolase (DUF442 family)
MNGSTPPEPGEIQPDLALAERRARRWRRRRITLVVLLVVTLGLAATFHRFLFLGNVGVVVEGELYRSGQPHNVEAIVRDYALGSILNLRGGSESDTWYRDEVEGTKALGVELYDFPMGATRRPLRRDLLAILDVLDRCKYPLLIHCKSGSDRTGLAVGLYLMAKRGVPPDRAREAFTLAHGHVAFGGPERLHEPLNEYSAWLLDRKLDHTPERFRDWVTNHYQADDPPRKPRPIEPGPRPRFASADREKGSR